MLAPDVEIVDIDGAHLRNWLGLLVPPGLSEEARLVILFLDRGRVVKAIERGAGALDPAGIPFTGTSRRALATLRRELGADAVVVLEADALPRLLSRVESSLRLEDDYVAQGVTVWRELKALAGAGMWVEPRILELLPVVSADALQRTFDLLVPDESSLVAYVIDDDRRAICASVIAVKRGGDITFVTTHLGVADAIDEAGFARDWRAQYPRLLQVIAERHAPASAAVFLERATYARILTGPADQLHAELAARNLIIDPIPAWLVGLLGGAAAVALAARSARALARLLPPGARQAATHLAGAAQDRLRESGAHPFALLGFDPVEVWHRVRAYYRPR